MSLSLRGVMKPGAACVGPECMGCASAHCMSSGGKVMGVHEDMGDYGGKKGVSPAGDSVRKMKEGTYKQFETVDPKQSHERVLKEMKMLPKPKLYAKGGSVKGVHDRYNPDNPRSVSTAGREARSGTNWDRSAKSGQASSPRIDRELAKEHLGNAKDEHKRVLGEMQSMPKPNLYAEGGEVMDADGDMDGDDGGDSAMLDSCAGELIDALDRKDKGQILEALKAIVLSVR